MNSEVTAGDPSGAPPAPAHAPAAVGEVLAGRWAVTGMRRGGQAWVLTVDDLAWGDRRAIKIPLSGSLVGDTELAVLFDIPPHPHVVTALEEVEIGDRRGIVLEYVPSTLAELLGRSRGAVPPDGLARLLQGVCAGMAHLSARTELAHLDLKPSNVLVDRDGTAKIADFGLAQQVSARGGRFPSARGGTWAYAAPEVLRQEPCDTRTDIFAFGVLLYQAYTGELPYPFRLDPEPAAQRRQLLEYYASPGPRTRTRELYYWGQGAMTQVPVAPPGEDVSIIVSSCLQDLPDQRPPSFRNLAAMLARGLGVPPAEVVTTSPGEGAAQRRALALSRALLRLGRAGEAVNRLNRLLTLRLPPELYTEVHRTTVQALTAAGRADEAAALEEWR